MGIILAILVFGTIVFVHELGHFLLAKANGIRVDEFSIGMGPRLLSKVKGETRYSLKLFPIGGSCMMGEDDAEDMSEGSFNSKSVWARIAVVAAGAVFNFILAFIFAVIIVGYTGYDEPVISGVVPGFSAEAEGMQAGDRIVKMNGKKINLWREVTYFNMFPGRRDPQDRKRPRIIPASLHIMVRQTRRCVPTGRSCFLRRRRPASTASDAAPDRPRHAVRRGQVQSAVDRAHPPPR